MMRTIPGIDRIERYDRLFRNKRIGLLTNFSGISSDWSKETADVFVAAGYHVVKLFTPEHGLYGAAAGEAVADFCHPKYHIPVISLYGEHRQPSTEELQGVDVLVYDIQDVGLRYYTYIYTMCLSIKACEACQIEFVVLDRPNPLGGVVEGPRIEKKYHCFVGNYELPMRYGLTAGEMARYYAEYSGCKTKIEVVKMEDYFSDMCFEDTGLIWNIPSPALPDYHSTLGYYGGCLFEGVNISEGRGTSKPFQMYGAPFIDMDLLYSDLQEVKMENVIFRQRAFVPMCGEYADQVCFGLEFYPQHRQVSFLPAAMYLLRAILRRYSGQIRFRASEELPEYRSLTVLAGSADIEAFLYDRCSLADLTEKWHEDCAEYARQIEQIRLYRSMN